MTTAPADLLVTCRACAHEFRAPARLAGRTVPCPHCQRPLPIAAPAAASEDKLVGREVGGCRLARRLGAGALGVVYEAEQTSVGRRVAIKMLSSKAAASSEVVARFQREAKLAASIQHPNVVGVYDCGFERGVHYLAMEFVDGTTWASMIEDADGGRLPWRQAVQMALQAAKALEHLHGHSIIHRDIKPANILVAKDGTAKLADLGLAKQVEAGNEDGAGLTMQGMALGSPAYMPPEQIRSARDADHRADLYALGASLYQALTGKLPFAGRSGTEVMTKVLKEAPPPIPTLAADVPKPVVALVERCMAKDAGQRPQTAGELVGLLEGLLTGERPRGAAAAPARRPGTGTAARKASGVNRGMLIIGAVALAVIAAVAAYLLLVR